MLNLNVFKLFMKKNMHNTFFSLLTLKKRVTVNIFYACKHCNYERRDNVIITFNRLYTHTGL